ncbi:hypothetical protein [Wolbachia endosymbiont of Trichogramma pretiosum]|uniref:hypothetical protein n=1 Tax=Wolbachia endosymbiont of Trichogramma pretiosum TaxID=125593 RepID=UPI000839737A|nr:hypothetical protein [Wolbachia endosymbiont of Trichogramma pretiosum]OCA05984.1 hypothetical protein wTpre_304 [Wolbachia endosymbiont of Trichogramma pretiosum]
MVRVNAGENSKKLKDSKNKTILPKKLRGSRYMSREQRQNYVKKLRNILESSEEAKSELKKRKFKIELKKDNKISEEGIEKVVELERKTEKEIEEIAMPVSKLPRKERIINFLEKSEKQVKEMQGLCRKRQLNAKIEKEFLNKLEDIEKESEKCCRELVSCMTNSNNPRILYTAVIGVGFAVGLVASTTLKYTTGLGMLAIIGIATASALVAGAATYEVLRPNTKIDELKEVQKEFSHSLF